MVASDGWATQGILKGYASTRHSVDTSSTSRVRRLGTMAMSSRWYPRCAVLPRPISTTSRIRNALVLLWAVGGAVERFSRSGGRGCGGGKPQSFFGRSCSAVGGATGRLSGVVVRGLDRHLDVVRVALLEARSGNPDELSALLQVGDRLGARVPHGQPH